VQSSSKGHFLVARFLIDKGSDVNHVDASGCTVDIHRHICIEEKYCIEIEIKRDRDVDVPA
jgi:hypothetical protein